MAAFAEFAHRLAAPFVWVWSWYPALAVAVAHPSLIRAGWRLGARFNPDDALAIVRAARDLANSEDDWTSAMVRLVVMAEQIASNQPTMTAPQIIRLLKRNAHMKHALGVICLGD